MPVYSVGLSADGGTVFAGSEDLSIRMFDIETGTLLHTLRGHVKPVTQIIPSTDDSALLTISNESAAKLWDIAKGKEKISLSGFMGRTESISFSPDGSMLASGSEYGLVKIWNYLEGREIWNYVLEEKYNYIHSVLFSPVGNFLATYAGKQVVLVDGKKGNEIKKLVAADGRIQSIAFSPDGSRLAFGMGAGDSSVLLWNLSTNQVIRKFIGSKMGVANQVVFSPDGARLAALLSDPGYGNAGDVIDVWDVTSGKAFPKIEYSTRGKITSIVFSPDGKILFGARDGKITLWEVSTGKEIRTLEGIRRD